MLHKQKLIVFPTSRAIRVYIQKEKIKNRLLPFTITIDEFFKKSIVLKDDFTYIDEEQRVLLLKDSIKDINISKLGISNKFSIFLKQYEYIYRFFVELSSEKCHIEDIQKSDTYDYYFEHLEILKKIRDNYIELLNENKLIDKINFSDNYEINKKFLEKFISCEIVFEGYFTKQELEIIDKISHFTNLQIEFNTNKYNKKSINSLNSLMDIVFDENFRYKIDLSNKSVISKEKNEYINNIKEIKGFSSRINQIAYIKSIIVNCVNKGINASNIAVVLPDESFADILSLFDVERYFNYAMGKNIEQSSIYQISKAINNYINEDEHKYIENLNYLNIEKKSIDNIIKPLWNKTINKSEFISLVEYIKTFENNKELLEKYDELIYKLQILFFTKTNRLKLKEIYKIYLQKLNEIKLDDVNSGKITVLGLLETRTIEFDLVIVCDFNEDYIPKVSLKDKFLSTAIKEKVNLPTSIDRQNLQKYYYKRLFENSKEVYISYVKSEQKTISRFANDLVTDNISDNVYDNEYKDILYFNTSLVHRQKDIKDKIDLKNFYWSASSLKIFLECKRKFYYQYMLKLKEHTLSLKPKSYELGNIVHNILERYYKENIDDIDKLFNEVKVDNSFLLLDLEIWKNRLKEFITLDKEYLQNKSIKELEKSFSIEVNGLKLKGVIDRIEKTGETYNVIDYKTSSSLSVDNLNNCKKSKDFQLEFYYLALSNLYKTTNIKAYYYDLHKLVLKEEIALSEKLEILSDIFEEIKDISSNEISFDMCEDKTPCQFCIYKTICNKE